MIAVAVSSESNLKNLESNRAELAKLADPRTIKLNDAEADKIVARATPIYYITGTIHSPETGAPTALMELAYRLAVDESPYIKEIRDGVVTLITPVVEVDGRDRMVDIYKWHLSHPNDFYPSLIYWGKYVAHDNNRDAMGVTLKLTENVLNTYAAWKVQVLHDLHESVPYLYDNTVGDGPYNAWIDPILADEWQMIGARNVADMTKFGMPGVFTHGDFDTWSPGYLMFIAAMHNGISRLYETFGNGGADTKERTLDPEEYARTWYRQNPPLPKTLWSQRDNNNYEETGLLTSLHYFNENKRMFLKNFYIKSKRSIEKPTAEGPAAYVLPGDDPRSELQAELLQVMDKQKVEISRATSAFTVTLPPKKKEEDAKHPTAQRRPRTKRRPTKIRKILSRPPANFPPAATSFAWTNRTRASPTRCSIINIGARTIRRKLRTTTPAGRSANYSACKSCASTDAKVLERRDGACERGEVARRRKRRRHCFRDQQQRAADAGDTALQLKDATMEAAEETFDSGGTKFNRGTILVKGVNRGDLDKAAARSGR